MKILKTLSLLLLTASLVACSGSSAPSETSEEEHIVLNATCPTPFNDKGYFNMQAPYYESRFFNKSDNFQKDLMLVSFLSATTAYSKSTHEHLFNQMGFDNYHYSATYDTGDTEDGYYLICSHKKIGEYDLIAFSFSGVNYTAEWMSNFNIGVEGDHAGFMYAMNNAYEEINAYIAENYANSKLKIWGTGYSRGAALANLTGCRLNSDTELNIPQDDIHIYTFEAPTSLIKSHVKNYKNIHNLYNTFDLVTYVPPKEYQLYRDGVDYDVYNENINSYFTGEFAYLDPIAFVPSDKYKKPIDFINDFLHILVTNGGDQTKADTRAEYMENLYPFFTALISLYAYNSLSTLLEFFASFSDIGYLELVILMANPESIEQLLLEKLELFEMTYTPENVHTIAYTGSPLFTTLAGKLVAMISSNMENMKNMVLIHMPDYQYVLLSNYK